MRRQQPTFSRKIERGGSDHGCLAFGDMTPPRPTDVLVQGDIKMEQYNSFISSRGLLKVCDIRNTHPVSSVPTIDFSVHDQLRHGASIYVCSEAIGLFATHVLGNINVPFVLVSGDSDLSLTEQIPGLGTIIESPFLTAWYAQNLNTSTEKLHHLPIGLDYHTAWQRAGHLEAVRMNPIQQEAILRCCLRFSKNLRDRVPKAYCNWHFNMRGNRQDCLRAVDASACHFEMERVPRSTTWMKQAEFMFTLSPEGVGMDCHRTWEAIFLGSIPVVNRNAISPLFDRLPVLIVDEWSEVTPRFLEDSFNRMIGQSYDFSSLFLHFWKTRFLNSTLDNTFVDLTIDEFRDRIC